MARKLLINSQVEVYTVTGTGSAQEVLHYFGSKPSVVLITPVETGDTGYFWDVAASSSTQVTVTLVVNVDYQVVIFPPFG